MNIRKIVANLCLTAGVGIVVIVGVMVWAHTPQVYQTAYSNDCVAIWTSEHGFTDCDSQPMPSRYESTVVMPGATFTDLARYQ